MTEKDIKLLWGRAANLCSICRVELSQTQSPASGAFVIGEQAHIVGEKQDAPRGKSPLSAEERDGYHNRILLCPNHHTEIDKNQVEWPVERLHIRKSEHELWVRETLTSVADAKMKAQQLAVSSIIDYTVKACQLERWKTWASQMLTPDPALEREIPENCFKLRQRIAASIWPKEFDELMRATTCLGWLLQAACQKFLEHAQLEQTHFVSQRFYKSKGYCSDYDLRVQMYEDWLLECSRLIKRATCAANWFADVVRRDINPLFFTESGKFLVEEGPCERFRYYAIMPEFTTEEKARLPGTMTDPYA
ncbi:MAG: hypothetical protein KF833_11105 [Verrucomicrobiae bacterium]|nr:hypothetical protein [Verrucomicrobiae bacterium]